MVVAQEKQFFFSGRWRLGPSCSEGVCLGNPIGAANVGVFSSLLEEETHLSADSLGPVCSEAEKYFNFICRFWKHDEVHGHNTPSGVEAAAPNLIQR